MAVFTARHVSLIYIPWYILGISIISILYNGTYLIYSIVDHHKCSEILKIDVFRFHWPSFYLTPSCHKELRLMDLHFGYKYLLSAFIIRQFDRNIGDAKIFQAEAFTIFCKHNWFRTQLRI
jgi:hypothetical protein